MRILLTIAAREYRAMVATKAFLITLALMPLLMVGGIAAPALLGKLKSVKTRQVVVVDQSGGQVFEMLNAAGIARNAELKKQAEREQQDSSDEEDSDDRIRSNFEDRSIYELTAFEGEWSEEAKFELSEKIRNRELYAFMVIPPDALTGGEAGNVPEVVLYSEDSALSDMRRWLGRSLNELIRVRRLSDAGIDLAVVSKALVPVAVTAMGLFQKDELSGDVIPAKKTNVLTSLLIPFGLMMMMFVMIFMSAQPMMESVLEEKTYRIAEVLLGCVNAQQLMLGKLLGNVAGSLTIFALYAGGAYSLIVWKGLSDQVPLEILPMFLVYQLLAVLLYSSIFMAIGAAVTQFKEAQSLLMPVWMLLMAPMFLMMPILQEPNGTAAVAVSFFPPGTPLAMVLRIASEAAIPTWQIIGTILLMLISTIVVVTVAGRIFQVGLLYQGKAPKITELIGWVVKNPMIGSTAGGPTQQRPDSSQ